MKDDLALFEDFKIRRVYDENKEIWFFSVIDIVQVLTQQTDNQKRLESIGINLKSD